MSDNAELVKAPPPAEADHRAAMELMERVVIGGDLAKLTPSQRMTYYTRLCASLRLNPLTQPFKYIVLQNRLTLYATKDATEQLRASRGVSITRLETIFEDAAGLCTVTAYGKDRTGREDVEVGVVNVKNIAAEALANARMKATTKAKRRLTLSLCGLGILDESEIEGNFVAAEVTVDPETGEIQGEYPPRDPLAETERGPDPDMPHPDAAHWLHKIGAGFELLKLGPEQIREKWIEFCGDTPVMSDEPDVEALRMLYDHLAAAFRTWRYVKRKGDA